MPASSSRFRRLTVHAPLLVPLSNLTMLQVTSLNEICTPEVQSVPTQERGIVWKKWRLCSKLFLRKKPVKHLMNLIPFFQTETAFHQLHFIQKCHVTKYRSLSPVNAVRPRPGRPVSILDESSDSVNPLEQWDIEH